MATKEEKAKIALTRARAEESKLAWERVLNLLESYSTELTKWVKATGYPSLEELAALLTGDLEDEDTLWNVMHQVKLVTNNEKAYSKKLSYIESLISKLEEEVLKTPTPSTEEGAVTTTDRQFQVNQKLTELEIAKEVFNDWETRFKKACAA